MRAYGQPRSGEAAQCRGGVSDMPMLIEPPRFAVLLATHNGACWLAEQLDSILAQTGGSLRLFVSDDQSSDQTLERLRDTAAVDPRVCLLPSDRIFGTANRNFLRLVRDAEIGDATHVAFADQDDVWYMGKLARAAFLLRLSGCNGYSGSVVASYPNGTTRRIDKAQPQRRFDHLFESPGPGCSFVLTRALFDAFKDFAIRKTAQTDAFAFHDWLIYAFARESGKRWFIDPIPMLRYRQHAANVLGANTGITAYWRRVAQVRSRSYATQVAALCMILRDEPGACKEWLTRLEREFGKRPGLLKRLSFCHLFVWQGRRRLRDRVTLAIFATFGWLWVGI